MECSVKNLEMTKLMLDFGAEINSRDLQDCFVVTNPCFPLCVPVSLPLTPPGTMVLVGFHTHWNPFRVCLILGGRD